MGRPPGRPRKLAPDDAGPPPLTGLSARLAAIEARLLALETARPALTVTGPPAPVDAVSRTRIEARRVAAGRGLPEPVTKGPANAHGPRCQCLACRRA
jgi:hypothetical protein